MHDAAPNVLPPVPLVSVVDDAEGVNGSVVRGHGQYVAVVRTVLNGVQLTRTNLHCPENQVFEKDILNKYLKFLS